MKPLKKLPAYPQTGVASTCRSIEEYCAMFSMDASEIEGPVLDVAGGASSFTASLRQRGIDAVAADPFYGGLTEEVIAAGFKEIGTSSEKIANMASVYDWSYYGSPEEHRRLRERSMELFAEDVRREDFESRYFPASLPNLPFEDGAFSMVFCSHFLFLYGEAFDLAFHAASVKELLRVLKPGGLLRIYPLITLKWEPYPYLADLIAEAKRYASPELAPSGLPFVPVKSPVLTLKKNAF